MKAPPTRPQPRDVPQRWAPPSPGVALVAGILLAFLGGWTLSDGELPAPLGWACTVLGTAFLITGAVAKGVAWGLDLHGEGGR